MVKKRTKIYPLLSTAAQLKSGIRKAKRKIKKNLSKPEFSILQGLNRSFARGDTSLKKNSVGGFGRQLTPRRGKVHNIIIKRHFKDRSTIDKNDPDLYVLGGIAGSGKSEVLAKKIPEKTIVINNDKFKERIAKRNPSPIKRLPLAHAPFLHDEASVLVQRSIEKARREKRDVTLDKTFKTFDKGKRIIQKFKDEGYDVHFLGTQKKPHETIPNTASRFIKEGRFVPPGVIAATGNQTSANVLKARKLTDSHEIYDTTVKGKPVLIFKSKKDLHHNFRDP